jgi:hypothetical protein
MGLFGSIGINNLLCISKHFTMTEQRQSLEALQDIKRMMERSSRFISLSGLSGVSAGIFALIGSWFAYNGYIGLFITIRLLFYLEKSPFE